jgi:hypothetical protein
LPAGENPRIVLRIADPGGGTLHGYITFIDRSADAFPLLSVIYNPPELKVAIADFSFCGKLRAGRVWPVMAISRSPSL